MKLYTIKWFCFILLFLTSTIVCAQDTFLYNAVKDFDYKVNGYAPFYVNNTYLAINPLQHEDKAGAALCTFDGSKHGIYTIEIEVKQEYDGESKYRLIVSGKEYDKLSYNRVPKDKEKDTTLVWKDVTVLKGDEIKIEAQSNSNGLYPEQGAPGGYAWSRGRWSSVTLTFKEPVPIMVNDASCCRGDRSIRVSIRGKALFVTNAVNEKYTLTLFTARGKSLAQIGKSENRIGSLSLNHFSPGVYLVFISTISGNVWQKFVLK